MVENQIKDLETEYNRLSKERADSAYMWGHAGESVYYESIWDNCVSKMSEIEKYIKSIGYNIIDSGTETKGKVLYYLYRFSKTN